MLPKSSERRLVFLSTLKQLVTASMLLFAKTEGCRLAFELIELGSRSKPFHWWFTHAKGFPISEDPYNVAHLIGHFKPAGKANPERVSKMEARIEVSDLSIGKLDLPEEFSLEDSLLKVPFGVEKFGSNLGSSVPWRWCYR
ncbi:hypothetical protein YC2023_094071 [Brassica napus]